MGTARYTSEPATDDTLTMLPSSAFIRLSWLLLQMNIPLTLTPLTLSHSSSSMSCTRMGALLTTPAALTAPSNFPNLLIVALSQASTFCRFVTLTLYVRTTAEEDFLLLMPKLFASLPLGSPQARQRLHKRQVGGQWQAQCLKRHQ